MPESEFRLREARSVSNFIASLDVTPAAVGMRTRRSGVPLHFALRWKVGMWPQSRLGVAGDTLHV